MHCGRFFYSQYTGTSGSSSISSAPEPKPRPKSAKFYYGYHNWPESTCSTRARKDKGVMTFEAVLNCARHKIDVRALPRQEISVHHYQRSDALPALGGISLGLKLASAHPVSAWLDRLVSGQMTWKDSKARFAAANVSASSPSQVNSDCSYATLGGSYR